MLCRDEIGISKGTLYRRKKARQPGCEREGTSADLCGVGAPADNLMHASRLQSKPDFDNVQGTVGLVEISVLALL